MADNTLFKEIGEEFLKEGFTKEDTIKGRVQSYPSSVSDNARPTLTRRFTVQGGVEPQNEGLQNKVSPYEDMLETALLLEDDDCPDYDIFDERLVEDEGEEEGYDPVPVYAFTDVATLNNSLALRGVTETKPVSASKTETKEPVKPKLSGRTNFTYSKDNNRNPLLDSTGSSRNQGIANSTIHCEGNLTINGDITGVVTVSGALTVNGKIAGNVKADKLFLNGTIIGDIDCNVFSPSKTAHFDGKIKTNGFDIR